MTPTTKLNSLGITEISGVDDAANMLSGWMVMKSRGGEGDLTPSGATVILKAMAEGKITPQDVLSPEELAKARSMQPRPFIENFGAVRPPGRADV